MSDWSPRLGLSGLSPTIQSTNDKECLAIVWSTLHLSQIRTTEKLARQSVILQQYAFEIQYRKGSQKRLANGLSCQPLPQLETELGAINEEHKSNWYNVARLLFHLPEEARFDLVSLHFLYQFGGKNL